MAKKGLSTENYKGVRDFYPEDMFIQNYIFDIWKQTCESFGFEEYNASPLESADLYKAKTGEEIVNEQTYTFTDRGNRQVTLRPEMTPTLARMIAKKQRDLTYPLRWYSIPNVFRYEKPQRGRLREHFQLNVDMYGVDGIESEIEMISLSNQIMINFGAKSDQFVIYVNDRKIINEIYNAYQLTDSERYMISKIIDKKNKISKISYENAIKELIGDKADDFINTIMTPKSVIEKLGNDNPDVIRIIELMESLSETGIKNVEFNPLLMRGFDYYSGTVFEIFDKSPENNRSLFGGGRFDELLSIFGKEPIPAIGFGMGDVTIRDFLETYNLLPEFKSKTSLYICNAGTKFLELNKIADQLRSNNINTIIDLSNKKVSDQIKKADKLKIPFIICVGENEIKNGKFELKRLSDGNTQTLTLDQMPSTINTK